ncbi:zinc carboxypeptidase [Arcticibacter pallidicorallinus]|uniref:Zinc carboxypeptidase n=1 Tax=Arcticibacter pallidicorallinus TaxID=1259464 RepID=A0A2T0UB63_9SPHI|nr:M14 family zinc carboxypeptidase [Arcticibacter pallidicorallinus]PRY55176.1 zinc carboxypeptidase [Arcticibacter pallidicorallinus]
MMRTKLLVTSAFITIGALVGFSLRREATRLAIEDTSIWQSYDRYQEQGIQHLMVKHTEIQPLINKHLASGLLRSGLQGTSVQGRSINHLVAGKGKTKVLLWSQMHGDESTATMALFDIFNFLSAADENDSFRRLLMEKLELHFVPMINPDGAELWKRRNAMDIDINRDARALTTPEGRFLMKVADEIKPRFGFNLHDQNALHSVGSSSKPATISFLAPAYNHARDMNETRENAAKMIILMNRTLQKYLPDQVAKYNDAHEPRGFGDTFQKKGISTILIESGGYLNDPQKQYIRKLNFYVLLSALHAIAKEAYEQEDVERYYSIPENGRFLFNVVIRNAEIVKDSLRYRTSVGINHYTSLDATRKRLNYRGAIDELADMHDNYGYHDVDAASLLSVPGKVIAMKKDEWEKLSLKSEAALLRQGYLYIRFSDQRSPTGPVPNRLLNLINGSPLSLSIALYQNANFVLAARDGKPAYAVVNGFLIDLNKEKISSLPNTYGY